MTTRFSEPEIQSAQEDGACVAGASTAEVLRLLGAGATGAILMALGEGPLRTKDLTERVPGYASRTIYRYAGKLAALDVVEREEEPGVPSKVVHTLSDPCGTELYALVDRFAERSLTRLPDGRVDAHAWASVGLVADLWEAGMVEALSCEARTPTELARGPHGLSYHQVNRRAALFQTAGLLAASEGAGPRRSFELTPKTRRAMGLVAGIGRWRHRHAVAEDEEGMTAAETATVLRASLPLAELDEHRDKCLQLTVLGKDAETGGDGETVWAEVERNGSIHSCAGPDSAVDGWARGQVGAWIATLLDGEPRSILCGGEEEVICDCLRALHDGLWKPTPS